MEAETIIGLNQHSAFPLMLMTLGAIAMPSLAKRIAIPVAVAEIVFGFLIGQSGFGIINDPNNPFIRFLSDLGFAFFLFLAGLEIDFKNIEVRKRELILPCIVSGIGFALAIYVAQTQGYNHWIGLALGATSVPLLLAVVRESGLGSSYLGHTMITFAAVGELLTIFLLSFIEIYTLAQGDIAALTWGFFLFFALIFVAILGASLLRLVMWWYPSFFTQMTAHDDPSEIGVRVGFGMMFFFIGLSMLAHVEPFLGAFVAGAILSFVIRDKGALEHKLSSMAYGFFVPVFFIHVGMRLDISFTMLIHQAQNILVILLIMFGAKLIPGLLMFRRGLSWNDILSTCLLLSAPLTLVIAIMELGVHNNVVSLADSSVVIAAGIIGSLIYPSIARKLLKQNKQLKETNHSPKSQVTH